MKTSAAQVLDELEETRTVVVWPKLCGCCGRLHSRGSWLELELVGVQRLDGFALELRNCSCQKPAPTLVVPLVVQADGLLRLPFDGEEVETI